MQSIDTFINRTIFIAQDEFHGSKYEIDTICSIEEKIETNSNQAIIKDNFMQQQTAIILFL